MSRRQLLALAGLLFSISLLLPGILLPVITVSGQLDPKGVAVLAPQLLDQGLSDTTVASLRPLINPAVFPCSNGARRTRGALVTQLGARSAGQLGIGQPIEVYRQTRSILGSVKHLYQVGSLTAATLILLFSVLVPLHQGGPGALGDIAPRCGCGAGAPCTSSS